MVSYLVRRVLYGALILLGVNLLTFFLFFTVNTPDDMARLNIGGKHVTQDLIEWPCCPFGVRDQRDFGPRAAVKKPDEGGMAPVRHNLPFIR